MVDLVDFGDSTNCGPSGFAGVPFRRYPVPVERTGDDTALLTSRLRIIDTKLAKVAVAIEAVGISDTLANRLAELEREKTKTEDAIQRTPAQIRYHPQSAEHVVSNVRSLLGSL